MVTQIENQLVCLFTNLSEGRRVRLRNLSLIDHSHRYSYLHRVGLQYHEEGTRL